MKIEECDYIRGDIIKSKCYRSLIFAFDHVDLFTNSIVIWIFRTDHSVAKYIFDYQDDEWSKI